MNLEQRLKDIAAQYDTILIGKVQSVAMRSAKTPSVRPWAVRVRVDEVIRGKELPGEITLFIHSPVREFGGYNKVEDLVRIPVHSIRRSGVVRSAVPEDSIRADRSEATYVFGCPPFL